MPALPPVPEGRLSSELPVPAAVSQRRLVPEGLFSEMDWHSSPYVSWELLVKLHSNLSITIKAIPICSFHGSYTSWSKTTATFNCLFSSFYFHSGSKQVSIWPLGPAAWLSTQPSSDRRYSSVKQCRADRLSTIVCQWSGSNFCS